MTTATEVPQARDQHLAALARANDYRVRRAETKRAIRKGDLGAAELLRDGIPEHMASMRVEDFLNCISRMRAKQRDRILKAALLNPVRRLSEVTPRQRNVLAKMLDKREVRLREGRRE